MFDFLFGKQPQIEDLFSFEGENCKCLMQFKETYTLESGTYSDMELSWYDSKTEGMPIVLLPGTTGKAEVWYMYLLALKNEYRVLMPDFPEVSTVEDLCDQIESWLQDLGIEKAILSGQSFGGAIAQRFADRYPDRVFKLILLTSFSNTITVKDKTRKNYNRSLSRFIKAVKDIKFASLQKSIYKQVIKGVDVAFVEDKAFWKAYYGNMFLESSVELLKTIHEVQIDFWRAVQHEPALYKGPTLLIEAKTDASYDREEKAALSKRYPTANKLEFEGSSNLAHIRELEFIVDAIRNF